MKIVINKCYGGFSLSHEAIMRYAELASLVNTEISVYSIERNDPFLVQTVEELGRAANGPHAELKVVEIPDDVQWHIAEAEYDGLEYIAENHRTWG